MKQLASNIKAELTGSDLLAAILSTQDLEQTVTELLSMSDVMANYVKNNKNNVTKSISKWVASKHNMKADKVIYHADKVLIEAHSLNGGVIIPEPTKRTRVAPEGHKKANSKIFDFLREYLSDERKKGSTELQFVTVLNDTKFFYPKMTDRLLQIYLHDKRQLKNIDFSAKRGTILLK